MPLLDSFTVDHTIMGAPACTRRENHEHSTWRY